MGLAAQRKLLPHWLVGKGSRAGAHAAAERRGVLLPAEGTLQRGCPDGRGCVILEAATYDTYGKVAVYDQTATGIPQSEIANPYYFTGRRLDLLPTASSSPRRVAGGDPQPAVDMFQSR